MAEENDDDLDLGDLRGVFSSMREMDEEPPQTGMAALMAAARVKADEMKPQPSLWERFFSAVSRPPVLAFAAVIVLVGGGAIMFNHRSEMKETVNAPAPSLELSRESDRKDEAKQAPAQTVAPIEAPSESQPEKLNAIITRPVDSSLDKFQGDVGGKKEGVKEKAVPTTQKTPTATQKTAPPPKKVHVSAGPSGATKGVGGEDENGAEFSDAVSAPKATQTIAPEEPAPAPVAPGGKAPTTTGSKAQLATDDVPAANGAAASVADLVKQCEAAAAAGNCAFVRQLAKKISVQDAAVYRAKILRNDKIAACLGDN